MSEHTPGPWSWEEVRAYHTSYIIRGGKLGNKIAQSFNWQDKGFDISSKSNARLIAAAPDLLEALIELRSFYIEMTGIPPVAANKAIAKAKGEEP